MSARRVVAAAGLAPAAAGAVGLAGLCQDLRGEAGKIKLYRLDRWGVVVEGVMLDDGDNGGLAGCIPSWW